jgi:pSer/pThr/pTyr-binding forkhead associated (FHA) protein
VHAHNGAIALAWSDPVTGEPYEEVVTLPATLGRAADNAVVLISEMISRHHATIARENGQLVLTDTSTNGTFVNGARQQRAVLGDGDAFQIGPYQISVRAAAAAPAPEVALAWTDPATHQPMRQTFALPLIIGRGSTSGLVLNDTEVSRAHATLAAEGGIVSVIDSSSNGTFVNGARQQQATLRDGDQLRIGATTFTVMLAAMSARAMTVPSHREAIIAMDERTMIEPLAANGAGRDPATVLPGGTIAQPGIPRAGQTAPPGAAAPPGASLSGQTVLPPMTARDDQTVLGAPAQRPAARAFPPPIFDQEYVSVAALGQTGLPVYTTVYALLGGGWGSFIMADNLIIYGVDPGAIISLGIYPEPFKRYQTLARNSQIPLHERLRSNSESTPDNIWGTPGYAAREAWHSFFSGHWGNAIHVLWQVFGEPSVSQTFTPIAGEVFASAAREAKRIGWDKVWRFGRIRAIRKTDDGRYAIAYSQSDDRQASHAILLANYVHLATGYPALQFLPDLQDYRARTGDFEHVINGYESHDYVYERLEQHGGVVLLRGRGIVASRLIQRISEARKKNPNIAILHLLRTPITKGHTWRHATRPVINHVEIQPFNWPKGAWGGEQREYIERADEETRLSLMADWGGTTTAQRGDWVRLVNRGLKEGWYKIEFGDVIGVDRGPDGRVVTRITGKGPLGGTTELVADYIIDATGLDAKANRNPLLQDTVNHYGLYVNKLGRIQVRNDMEVLGMRNGPGRFFAVGAMTLGGPLAGADTFLGLQAAAAVVVEHLVKEHAPGVRRLGPLRSLYQWTKWVRKVAP